MRLGPLKFQRTRKSKADQFLPSLASFSTLLQQQVREETEGIAAALRRPLSYNHEKCGHVKIR